MKELEMSREADEATPKALPHWRECERGGKPPSRWGSGDLRLEIINIWVLSPAA